MLRLVITRRARRLLAAVALLSAASAPAEGRWRAYENAALIPHPFNDGDSFHVMIKGREHVFRLYFVDAPETDASFPDRLADQAKYWHTDPKSALLLGAQAARFTTDFLKSGFAVQTKDEDAKGRGEFPRRFALVRVGDRDLAEALVEQGLARVYGEETDLPDGTPADKVWSRLYAAQRRAKAGRRGGWGLQAVRRPDREPPAPTLTPRESSP
jgi:endonuclease YncB( thermonuclease family)